MQAAALHGIVLKNLILTRGLRREVSNAAIGWA